MHYTKYIVIAASLVAVSVNASATDSFPQITTLRLEGRLSEAQSLAEERLLEEQASSRQVELHLELARIHDRVGLHQNTRPVADSLNHVELATEAAEANHKPSLARIELARADYFYRAEMREREFPIAEKHAQLAIDMFHEIGDRHGEAEAVHRLGLIEMQRGNMESAHELFDRSLEVDRAAGERTFFRGEYERHVGFVLMHRGDVEGAIPYFQRSLTYRREAGAIDASLFAASTLGSALVELGRLEEARTYLRYGMMVAEKIGSPVGTVRIGLVEGRLHAREGDKLAARLAYEKTVSVAESIGYSSVAGQARRELDAL
jgi:tetratricopeptide (TPR) repeat protein